MQATKRQRSLVLIVLMNMAWTSACTTLHETPVGNSPPQSLSVQVGERVRITMKDGRKEEFKVVAVEQDALVGKKVRVRYEDIDVLEVRQRDQEKTGVLTALAIVGGVFLTVAIVEAFSQLGALAAYE